MKSTGCLCWRDEWSARVDCLIPLLLRQWLRPNTGSCVVRTMVHLSGSICLFLLCHLRVHNMWRRCELIMMRGCVCVRCQPALANAAVTSNCLLHASEWKKNWHNPFHAPFQIPFPSASPPRLLREAFVVFCDDFQECRWKSGKDLKEGGGGGGEVRLSHTAISAASTFPLLPLLLLCIRVPQRLSLFWHLSWACLWV